MIAAEKGKIEQGGNKKKPLDLQAQTR